MEGATDNKIVNSPGRVPERLLRDHGSRCE
jgi:hypothetical protein